MKKETCEGCGEPLEKRRGNHRYHDRKCQQAAYLKRRESKLPHVSPLVPLVVLAGVDTLYLNAYHADVERYTRIERSLDETLQETFTSLQQQAKETGEEAATPWKLEDKPLHMLSHGSGKQWHWILRNDWLNMQIGNGDYRGLIAHIRVSSEYLWRVNALHLVLGLLNGFINRLFAHEMVLVPSAIDLCADVANWPMTSINHLALIACARKHRPIYEDASLYIAGKETWNGRKLGTLYVGMRTSPVHGKLYDKLKEIKDGGNKKAWFLELYKRNGWDGEGPVTRLEISLTREALHDLDIETDYDLMHNLKGLWAYAVGSETVKPWLRYTIPTDDKTQTRWPLHPYWPLVQRAFDSLSEEPARELIRIHKQQTNIDAATASLAGYLSTKTVWQCAQEGTSIQDQDVGTALNDLWNGIDALFRKKGVTFQEVLQAKQQRYYLRQEQTRDAAMQRVKSLSDRHQEVI